jgi:23S rRNA (guanosine2251-2'-O)-methyltransferase
MNSTRQPPTHRRPGSSDGSRQTSLQTKAQTKAQTKERRAVPRAGKGAENGVLWLWGIHPVLAALANRSRHCHRFVATAEALRAHATEIEMLTRARPLPQVEALERADIDTLLPLGAVHQGLAVQVDTLPPAAIADLIDAARGRDNAVIVVLDQVTDPQNVGAVLRSAAAFGAVGMVVQDRHTPEETGALAKAASGALERLPLARVTNLARGLEELKAGGFWVAGLAGDAPVTLAAANLTGQIALVLGSEGEGLRRLTREHCDHLVKLPQTELVESLNVSNAAAVALYELVRR